MPINNYFLMPGILHETWSGVVTANELYESQERFISQVQQDARSRYVVVLEVQKGAKLPPVYNLLSLSKRFPRSIKMEYFVVNTSMFNESITNALTRIARIPIRLFPDLNKAVETAKLQIEKAG